jgi:hypothetical protein
LVVEMWMYPDGTRTLEISTKCEPTEMFQVSAELRAYLHECGIEIGAEQQTKTKAALEFFKADVQVNGSGGVS